MLLVSVLAVLATSLVAAQSPGTIPDLSGLGSCTSACGGFNDITACTNTTFTTAADATAAEKCVCDVYAKAIPPCANCINGINQEAATQLNQVLEACKNGSLTSGLSGDTGSTATTDSGFSTATSSIPSATGGADTLTASATGGSGTSQSTQSASPSTTHKSGSAKVTVGMGLLAVVMFGAYVVV